MRRAGSVSDASRVCGCTRGRYRTSVRLEVGAGQGEPEPSAYGSEGVGGLHTSFDVGERVAPDPAEQRRPVCR